MIHELTCAKCGCEYYFDDEDSPEYISMCCSLGCYESLTGHEGFIQ